MKKYVYVCDGFDDYEGGKVYVVFDTEDKAKQWVEDSEKLTNNYYVDFGGKRKEIDKKLEEMHSEKCDNYRYSKQELL